MDKPVPQDYQPPLGWWGHTWRTVVVVAISLAVWYEVFPHQVERLWLMALDVVLGIFCLGLMFLRRRWPFPVAVVTNVLSSFSAFAAGPATLAGVSLATRRRWREIIPIGVLAVVSAQVLMVVQPPRSNDPLWLNLSFNVLFVAAMLAWGMYIGSRRELLWTLRQRAERAEAEQELRVAQARGTERARIAREMHDVLAHRISQISLHAGALGFRDDLSAEEMRASAAVIREKAHEALTDLRGVLGVLRDGSGEPMDAPQPTYDDLPGLVEEARQSGLRVEYRDAVPTDANVPDVLGRTVYRIVQEGITNARKHAPGSVLTIELSGSPESGLDVVMSNPIGFGPTGTPGAGLGLVGLTERAELRGGRLEHRQEDGTFVLRGWIPWAA